MKGVYYTLAYEPFIDISDKGAWNKNSNPNLLPKDIWIGLRSEVVTDSSGVVNIKVYVDMGKTGNWVLVVEAEDDGKSYSGPAFLEAGHAGIRTDFMDVEFDDYSIRSIFILSAISLSSPSSSLIGSAITYHSSKALR